VRGTRLGDPSSNLHERDVPIFVPEVAVVTVIQTVRGPISPSDLGVTLPHEHLMASTAEVNFQPPQSSTDADFSSLPVSFEIRGWLEYNWQSNRDNLSLDDEPLAIAETQLYRRAGGVSLIDLTPIGIGRDPLALSRISEATDVHVVMGCGYYVAATHPPEVQSLTAQDIANEICVEFEHGVADTGIRPGVIGEIGCSWPLLPSEAKVLEGAAVAQTRLGAALFVHPGRHPNAPFEILKLLEDKGADSSRVVICHIERTVQRPDDLASLLKLGCYIEFDLFGMETTSTYFRHLGIDIPTDAQRLDLILDLANQGYGNRLLISHDICFKHRLVRYGGHGYAHILDNVLPWALQRGFTQDNLDELLERNPRELIELR
jgi:phosphotriesterase-related protein